MSMDTRTSQIKALRRAAKTLTASEVLGHRRAAEGLKIETSTSLTGDEQRFLTACCTFFDQPAIVFELEGDHALLMPGYPGSNPIVRACGRLIIQAAARRASAAVQGAR